jgi:hypothetical protein
LTQDKDAPTSFHATIPFGVSVAMNAAGTLEGSDLVIHYTITDVADAQAIHRNGTLKLHRATTTGE